MPKFELACKRHNATLALGHPSTVTASPNYRIAATNLVWHDKQMVIDSIINSIRQSRARITDQADEVAFDDELTDEEIYASVVQGEIIEDYPDDWPYSSCLILGRNFSGETIHNVCALGARVRLGRFNHSLSTRSHSVGWIGKRGLKNDSIWKVSGLRWRTRKQTGRKTTKRWRQYSGDESHCGRMPSLWRAAVW